MGGDELGSELPPQAARVTAKPTSTAARRPVTCSRLRRRASEGRSGFYVVHVPCRCDLLWGGVRRMEAFYDERGNGAVTLLPTCYRSTGIVGPTNSQLSSPPRHARPGCERQSTTRKLTEGST